MIPGEETVPQQRRQRQLHGQHLAEQRLQRQQRQQRPAHRRPADEHAPQSAAHAVDRLVEPERQHHAGQQEMLLNNSLVGLTVGTERTLLMLDTK